MKKPGKSSEDPNSFRPINNLNIIEKVVEALMKEQIDEFIEEEKIIPEQHHGGRPNHSTSTAKMMIDENLSKAKSKKKSSAILMTDLSVAFDLCDHLILLEKLEHIGFRGPAYSLIENYLSDRSFYVEVQGSYSDLTKMPPVSVVQGSKLSSLFYTLYTLKKWRVNIIMRHPKKYEE